MKQVGAVVAAASMLLAACASAQSPVPHYPARPVRIVVPFTPGSATDILARLIGPKLQEQWGQQIIVDNRPSAGGTVAGGIVASAAPDGHTLLLTSSAFAGAAALYDKLPYDSVRDFAGITQIAGTPLLVVVAPDLGVKSVKELIALAREKPGEINFGSSGIGSGTHYAGELFMQTAGINVVHVPYRGTPEVLNDVIAGRIQFYVAPVLAAMSLVRNGRLLALTVTTRERLPILPDVPTVAEAALPGFEYDGWFGMLAPARTPKAIIKALSEEAARILSLPDVRERITSTGAVPKTSSPAAFEQYIHDEIAKRRKVFRAAGVKVE